MINPFGEDDDDYDINWLIDRHTAVRDSIIERKKEFLREFDYKTSFRFSLVGRQDVTSRL